MASQRTRPLGQIFLESNLELRAQKAFFRTNLKTLSDIVKTQSKRRRLVNTPISSIRTESSFGANTPSIERTTFGELLKYQMPVRERILSANENNDTPTVASRTRLCRRHSHKDQTDRKSIHCDVFGPDFCSDCSQLQRKQREANKNKQLLPVLGSETRSLVIPEKVALLSVSSSQIGSRSPYSESENSSKPCVNSISPNPALYTESEVYERLRTLHKVKRGLVFGKGERNYGDEYFNLPRETREHTPKEIKRLRVRQPSIDDVNMKISISFMNYQ